MLDEPSVVRTAPDTAMKPGRSRHWAWLAAAAVLLGAVVLWWRHPPAPAAPEAAAGASAPAASGTFAGRGFAAGAHAQPVTVAPATRRDIHITANVIGTIAAANTAVVHTRADGELKALYFKEGQPVRAGQVLALIDPRPFQIALNQAQGTLAHDQAQLLNARLDLQRYRDLVAKDAAPKQQFDTQAALVQQIEGTVLADQAAVDNARLQLSYTRVVAPISGLAGLKQADLGNIVHAADPNGLLTIAQTQPAAVVFAVPEAQLARIRAGLKDATPLPVQAWDREHKTMLAEGRVASTDNTIDATTGTIRVKALFPNAENSLFPNQFVNVELQLQTLPDALAVPSAAIQRGAPGVFVYVVGSDGTVALRRVTPLATDGDWVAVRGELQAGEKVVTDGADRLRDGAKVEVIAAAARAASGAGSGAGHGSGRRRGGGAPLSASAAGSASEPASEPAPGHVSGHAASDAATAPPRTGTARAPVARGSASDAAAARGAAWMKRVPSEVLDSIPPELLTKLDAMSPQERRAWFEGRKDANLSAPTR